jgi:hypothetical protein
MKMEQSASIGKLALALSKAQAMLDGASKSSDNPFFKSKYADLHECISAAKEALAANELAVFQTTDADDKGILVYTTIAHSSGEWARGKIRMIPKKNDDQSIGSSITYGRRYGFAAIVGLAQKDDDGNSNMESEKPQAEKPHDAPKGNSTVLQKWLDWVDSFTAKTLDEFTVEWEKYAAAIAKLPATDAKKLQIARNEMITFLMEKAKMEKAA